MELFPNSQLFPNNHKPIGIWLLVGCVMIYIMILLGGITRLTGSGLSIVEWNVIMGTLPPMNEQQWMEAFDKYKQFPQFKQINQEMILPDFKYIFFWEYFHRLWGRLIGIVFIVPFIYFLIKKQINKSMMMDLIVIFLLGAIQGFVGWVMVKSGLVDKPLVSPYRLTLHLLLALFLYSYLLWMALKILIPKTNNPFLTESTMVRKFTYFIIGVMGIQLFLGGLMSGMKAALIYPTFPTMNGEIIPSPLMINSNWDWDIFINYDQYIFAPTLIQFCHRMTGYMLAFMILILWQWTKNDEYTDALKKRSKWLFAMMVFQIVLGIIVLLKVQMGKIPVFWGVIHQAGAVVLLSLAIIINYYCQFSTIIPKKED